MNVCPCVYITMFGIFRLANFGEFSNLYFYNTFPMKTDYFKKNITSEVELKNIKTAYIKYDQYITRELYIKLCTLLPESTLYIKKTSDKIFKKNGAEQVRRMLSKCYSKDTVNLGDNSRFKKYHSLNMSFIIILTYIFILGIVFNVNATDKYYLKSIKKIKSTAKCAIITNTRDTKIKIDKMEQKLIECEHVSIRKIYLQLRAADEEETCITICNDCKRKI